MGTELLPLLSANTPSTDFFLLYLVESIINPCQARDTSAWPPGQRVPGPAQLITCQAGSTQEER